MQHLRVHRKFQDLVSPLLHCMLIMKAMSDLCPTEIVVDRIITISYHLSMPLYCPLVWYAWADFLLCPHVILDLCHGSLLFSRHIPVS